MCRSSDLLDTAVLVCGCIYNLNLDIIENNIIEDYIKICKNHYKYKIHKKKFILNKQTNVYEKNMLKNEKIINFGKYKHKSFNYVYHKDKTYCYNLTFWKKETPTSNNNLNEFITYVKNAILLY